MVAIKNALSRLSLGGAIHDDGDLIFSRAIARFLQARVYALMTLCSGFLVKKPFVFLFCVAKNC